MVNYTTKCRMKSNFFSVFFKKVEDTIIFPVSRAGFFQDAGSVRMQIATPLYPPLSGGQACTPQNRTYRSGILKWLLNPTTLNPY